jgi:tetratricopeptide (TPR) repeat protein
MGESGRGAANITKGYELRDRASEREKFAISTTYNSYVTGDLEQVAQICEQWTKLFPHDPEAFLALHGAHFTAGRWNEALAAGREAFRLEPVGMTYRVVAIDYLLLGRLDEARATVQQGEANHVDPVVFRDVLYLLAFLRNDSAGMAEQLTGPWINCEPGVTDDEQSFTAAYYGHLSRSRELTQRAVASAKEHGATDVIADYEVHAALVEALFGNFPEARKAMKGAANFRTNRDLEGLAAIIRALSGDASQAQKLVDDLNKRFPQATYVRLGYLPQIRSLLAIRRGNVQEGIEDLRPSSSLALVVLMGGVYINGQAYLAAHRGAEAATEFQKIIDHPSVVLNWPVGALAHLGLGRAYVLQGDTAKARTAYQDFLALWKDADPDIPILKQAKAEYANLQ